VNEAGEPAGGPAGASEAREVAGVVAPPPLIYLAGLGIGFGLEALLPSASLDGAVRVPLGVVLIVAGLGFMGSFLGAFGRARTPVDPRRPTTAIVTGGPYRLTRNPAYLGMALLYSGIAILTGTLWAFASLVPTLLVIDRGVIAREERYLEAKFGEEYLRYRARVRRWV
jgi:protein-S-isoprenylcysteine O-methyltransferase Ste14